jgi:hypothetical protein
MAMALGFEMPTAICEQRIADLPETGHAHRRPL